MKYKQAGFTLIELLVVLVIISIVAGVALMTYSTNQNKQFETVGNQLTNSIILAEQEAMLRPATLGLAFMPHTFQFYLYTHDEKTKANAWKPLAEKPFGLQRISDNTQIRLKMFGETIEPDGLPKLIISPSGDLTPFIIYIGKKQKTPYYQITGKANGEVVGAALPQK